MDGNAVEVTIKSHLRHIRERIDEAGAIAKAAEACSEAGNLPRAVGILLDVEQLLYEVTTLLNATSLMQRMSKSDAELLTGRGIRD